MITEWPPPLVRRISRFTIGTVRPQVAAIDKAYPTDTTGAKHGRQEDRQGPAKTRPKEASDAGPYPSSEELITGRLGCVMNQPGVSTGPSCSASCVQIMG